MNWVLFQNSLLVSALTTVLATLFGVLAALFVSGLEPGWRGLFLAAAVVALALPPFLVTNCWLSLLGQTGLWRRWLPLNIYSLGGTVWILALLLWAIPLFAALAGWQKIEPSLIESEGALTGLAFVRWLLLPAAQSSLHVAALIVLVLALGNFAVPAILQVKVFPAELWVRFSTNFDYLGALALSVPIVLAPLAVALWLRRTPVVWPRLEGPVPAALFRRRLGLLWWGAAVVPMLVALLAVALPVGNLVLAPRTWMELPGAFAAGQGAMLASVGFAGVTATLTVAAGLATWRWRWAGALWVLFFVPGVLLGVALIYLLNRPPLIAFYQSVGIVVVALALRYLSLGRQGAALARRAVDPDLEDAARLEGASRWQRTWAVRWPQMKPQLAAAWYVVYLLCLWDVETPVLIVPPGGETLALRIFNFLHYGHNAQVNALCLLLLVLAVAPLGLWTLGRVIRRPAYA